VKRIEEIKIKVNFDYCFSVDYVGRSGIIVVLWINLFCVVSWNFHKISLIWRSTSLINMFGVSPDFMVRNRRKDSWDLLRTLAVDNSLPWCIMRDFNDILSIDDKKGCVWSPFLALEGLSRCNFKDANLIDIPIQGYPFTWWKSKALLTRWKRGLIEPLQDKIGLMFSLIIALWMVLLEFQPGLL